MINKLIDYTSSYQLVLLLSLAVLASCIPEPLEVKSVPTVKPEIVVNTQFIPDQTLVVLLTRTFGALEASDDSDAEALLEQIAVADAEVVLQGPSGTYTLRNLELGVYGGVSIPFRAGETYTLSVYSPTMGAVSATTQVSQRVPFDTVAADLYYNDFGDTLAQVFYAITDPQEKNWYMLNVQEVEREDAISNILNPRAFTVLVDDADFKDPQFFDAFRVFPRDYAPGDTIAVSLSNVSEEYYRFMEMRMDNRFSFTEFFGEPVNYSSNVVGGKGFFNLYVPDVRVFIFEESEEPVEGE